MRTDPRPGIPALLSILLALGLASCGGGLRGDVYDPDQARRDQRALRIKVVRIQDNFNRDWSSDPRISHVVEVEVLDGPAEMMGHPVVLPYDAFSLAKDPPAVGSETVMSPADWLRQPPTQKFRMRER